MPKLMTDDMESKVVPGSSYSFSAVRPDTLGASEYTLVTIAVDTTGSVSGYEKDLLAMLKIAIESCKKSPRAENLLARVLVFNSVVGIQELHGFKALDMINVNDYNLGRIYGSTPLFDVTYNAIGATLNYAKDLIDQFFTVNGIVFVITDGDDNSSKTSPSQIRALSKQAASGEQIESLISILIGINTSSCSSYLDAFYKAASLTQYVDCKDASAGTLAKLATFVSKSTSSQSQALGSGGPSKTLTF